MGAFKGRGWFSKNSLSLKLLIATGAVSLLASVALTAAQLYFDYQRDFKKLSENLDMIETSYLQSIAENLWAYDTRLLNIQLEGLSRLPGVSFLRLTADGRILFEHGSFQPLESGDKHFDIIYPENNETLGSLDVQLDIRALRSRYITEAGWVFTREAAKTLLVVLCLFFIFNNVLVVHIKRIASYLRNPVKNENSTLKLKRHNSQKDELDILVTAINTFRSELFEANKKLSTLNHDLEAKVEDRTRQLTTKNASLEKAMNQIKRMQATLVAQERLASLGSLTASVAHEIRNPLNFVLNFSELLTETESLEEVGEISRVILKHSQRIDQIVRSMQILSGYDSDTFEVLNLNDLMMKAYQETIASRSLASSYIPPKVTYRLAESISTHVYPQALLRALTNIIDNAINALEKKSITNKSFEPELILSTSVRDEMAVLTIRDNGAGIPSILGEKVFDPFLSTKASGEGAGLGLTVAFNIAQKHGGTLKYASELGQWTEFSLSIPLAHERVTT